MCALWLLKWLKVVEWYRCRCDGKDERKNIENVCLKQFDEMREEKSFSVFSSCCHNNFLLVFVAYAAINSCVSFFCYV